MTIIKAIQIEYCGACETVAPIVGEWLECYCI